MSGNAYYHSVQNLLSCSLLSKIVKIKICRTIILSVVLYGCETWSLKLRERVLVNSALKRIFGPKRNEVTAQQERLHNEEIYAVYSSPSIIRVIKSRRFRWTEILARMGERRVMYRVLVKKPEGRRPLGGRKLRQENNIKMYLQRVECGMDWIDLAQDRDSQRALVKAVMNTSFHEMRVFS